MVRKYAEEIEMTAKPHTAEGIACTTEIVDAEQLVPYFLSMRERLGERLEASPAEYIREEELPEAFRPASEDGTRIVMYIDPGTGSMLFSIVIGIAATGIYFLQSLKVKLKYNGLGKHGEEKEGEKLPLVIFAESKRYWNVFESVCRELERREMRCEYWTTSEDDPCFAAGFRYVRPVFIGEGNRAYAKLNLMNADVCLATTPGLDVLQWKRSKNVRKYIHIFHALDPGNGYRMFGLDYYDTVLMTGEFCAENIRELEQLRGLPEKELIVTGSTYMDSLLARKEELPQTEEKEHVPTVLLAPSWGASSALNRFGEKLLDGLIASGYHIIVRPHPQTKTADAELLEGLMKKYPDGEALEWNFDRDNFEVLNRSDLMISDFSGVVLDYTLVFDRPLLYLDTSYDPAPYDAAWSEKPYWNLRALPRLGKQVTEADFPRLKEIIDGMLTENVWKQGRDEIRAEAWQYPGEAAARTVDVLEKEAGKKA